MDFSTLKINVLGASNTCITKSAEKRTVRDVNFPLMLGEILGCTVRGYGVVGCNIAVGPERTDSYVERMADMDPDANVIIIQGEGNDCYWNRPLGTPGEIDASTFCGAMGLCIQKAREMYPGALILGLSAMRKVLPTTRADGLTHLDFHDAFMKTCAAFGIDCYDFVLDANLSPEDPTMMPDGIHMSAKGCRYYSEIVAEMVKREKRD